MGFNSLVIKLFLISLSYVKVIYKLGLWNVIYVLWYRFTLKTGIKKRRFPPENINTGEFFSPKIEVLTDFPVEWKEPILVAADKIIKGQLRYYGFHWKTIGYPPDWFFNPFNGKHYQNCQKHWTELPDFAEDFGDIKNLWEAARFEWVVTLSRAYAVSGNINYLNTLNEWLNDWIKKNPMNIGPNWKCGQEASIRVFNLLSAAYILRQWTNPSHVLSEIIYMHLKRISNNILYAIAQNNNHGTSEAAALFIGGRWLEKYTPGRYTEAKKFGNRGQFWLENRVKKLIAHDGSFSQHSVNYHRVMLDTLCYEEFWRKALGANKFSKIFYTKAKAATFWLWMLTDEMSGHSPNLGANDGAMLLHLHSCPYQNFRPTLQLACALFENKKFYEDGPWNEALFWLSINSDLLPVWNRSRNSTTLDKSYTIIISDNSWALFRLPNFRFRPVHNDVFHFDLWYKGRNVLCDSGTYSYFGNSNNGELNLKSIKYHNTVCFDNNEQMPDLSRFLLSGWIKPGKAGEIKNKNGISWAGSYNDNNCNHHRREIAISGNRWIITDLLDGKFNFAIIGFNLNTSKYSWYGNILQTDFGTIFPPEGTECRIIEGIISPTYKETEKINRLEIKILSQGSYITIIELIDNPVI